MQVEPSAPKSVTSDMLDLISLVCSSFPSLWVVASLLKSGSILAVLWGSFSTFIKAQEALKAGDAKLGIKHLSNAIAQAILSPIPARSILRNAGIESLLKKRIAQNLRNWDTERLTEFAKSIVQNTKHQRLNPKL